MEKSQTGDPISFSTGSCNKYRTVGPQTLDILLPITLGVEIRAQRGQALLDALPGCSHRVSPRDCMAEREIPQLLRKHQSRLVVHTERQEQEDHGQFMASQGCTVRGCCSQPKRYNVLSYSIRSPLCLQPRADQDTGESNPFYFWCTSPSTSYTNCDSLSEHTLSHHTLLKTQQGPGQEQTGEELPRPAVLPARGTVCSAVIFVVHLFIQQTFTEYLLCARLRTPKGKQIRVHML